MIPANLSCQSHSADCRCSCRKFFVLVCYKKCCHKSRQLTSCPCNFSHLWTPVSYYITRFSVTDQINRSGHCHNTSCFFCKCLYKCDCLIEILLGHCICHISIHTFCRAASQCQRLNLGNISADYIEGKFFHQVNRCICAKRTCSCSHRIKKQYMTKLLRFLAG